jgi:hypothetical protein
MKSSRHLFLVSIPVVLALLFSTLEAIPVYADDATPPTDQVAETVESSSSTESAPADPTEEPLLTELTGTDSTQESTTEAVEPTEEPTLEITVAATEPLVQEEDVNTIPEILAAVPDGTEIIVLDENGDPQSLASEEAAETLVQGDPVWCPEGATPGDATCTASYATFNELIDALEADAALGAGAVYTGNGVIWVADSYYQNDDDQIVFNGSLLSNINSSNLTIQGGWDDGTTNFGTSGASDLDVSMLIYDWIGNIAINNIFIDSSQPVHFGLYIATDGTINLDNVSVTNTGTAAAGTNDGADLFSGGNITVEDSQFNSNDGTGLEAHSTSGNILLTDVTAENNTLTGAYLDTCNLSVDGCLGTGNIRVEGTNIFSGNNADGLYIDSGGQTYLTNMTAIGNGTVGIFIVSGANGLGGPVDILTATVQDNMGGPGIYIGQYANSYINLENVLATGNDFGTFIENFGTSTVNVTNSQFTQNVKTGLDIASVGNIYLFGVDAGKYGSYNGNNSNGAYLVSYGDIDVLSSTFNGNVQNSSPADPGLYAEATGNITLTTVSASDNKYGTGAVLVSTGIGNITVHGITNVFNSNGVFGLQAQANGGDITLDPLTASYNGIKGAYLSNAGVGEIDLANADFIENGSYGIYANTDKGDINLNNVTETGDDGIAPLTDATDIGAKLVSNSGNIFVTDSTFELNTDTGLVIVGNNTATLDTVTSTQNGTDEIAIYSSYTEKGCYCPGDTPTSILVNIDGGIIGDATVDAQYGLYVRPGPEGSVTFITDPTYGTFDPQENQYVLDMTELPECTKCGCDTPEEKPEGKPYQIIEVPFSGSGNIPQTCNIYAGTIMEMPDGTFVKVGCPFDGMSNLMGLNEADLPGLLGAGDKFDLAILLKLIGEDGSIILNSDGTITITFKIPETTRGRSHRLLFWDTTLNDDAGGWYQMPPYEKGTNFLLHPDDPDDHRMIVNGVSQNGTTMTITVNFGGTFVMVSN